MGGKRKIPKLKVPFEEWKSFIGDNRKLIINETVSACEEMIQTDVESLDVIQFEVISNGKSTTLIECKVFREDMKVGLEKLMKASIEEEQYELSHRIKLLQDYISVLNG